MVFFLILFVYFLSFLWKSRQIQKILDDPTESTKCEKYLASLTAGERIPWAQTRNKYFSKGTNLASLSAIEKVISEFISIQIDVD